MRGPTKPPDTPNLPELQKSRDRFVLRNEFRPSRQSSLPSKRIRKARTFDIAGDAGRGYVMLRTLTEAALARKLKHQNGLTCHHTFGIGACFRSPPRYWPASLGAIRTSSRPRDSAQAKNRLTAIRQAARVCSLRMRPKKNSSAAKTAACPARARMSGNWLRSVWI